MKEQFIYDVVKKNIALKLKYSLCGIHASSIHIKLKANLIFFIRIISNVHLVNGKNTKMK